MRIDLKTASTDEIIGFVKRQNKHIRQVEELLERYEARHKEYKQQLKEYADQVQSLRTLEHVQGDEALKQRIQALLVERDALAAEMQALSESQHRQSQQTKETPSISEEDYQRLKAALTTKETNLAQLLAERNELEQRLTGLLQRQKEEINTLTTSLSSLQTQATQSNRAVEALKARLAAVASEHSVQLQRTTSEHQTQVTALQTKLQTLQEEISTKNALAAHVSESAPPTENADIAALTSERDTLKTQIDSLSKELETLRARTTGVDSTSTPPSEPTPSPSRTPTDSTRTSLDVPAEATQPANQAEFAEKTERIKTLEDKLQAKQQLLVKAHKHLGDLTAQLADAKLKADKALAERDMLNTQLKNLMARLESTTLATTESATRIQQLEGQLEEMSQDFQQYKLKVAFQAQNTQTAENSTSTTSSSSEVPLVLQQMVTHLTERVQQLESANALILETSQRESLELSSLQAKHDAALARMRQLKEKDAARTTESEKQQSDLKTAEDKHKARILDLEAQIDAVGASHAQQMIKLRKQADESVKQKELEIAMLKDTIEVLKIQAQQAADSKRAAAVVPRSDSATDPTQRLSSRVDAGSPTRRRIRTSASEEKGPSSLLSSVVGSDSGNVPAISGRDDQATQTQQLLTRVNALQDQVGELEQLLALSREQEQFLKLELRRHDRTTAAAAPTANGSSSTPYVASDISVLRNVVKKMLETNEIPSLHVFADLLRFSPEEITYLQQKIQANAQASSTVASAVGSGINALWNVFGTPQR